MKRAVSLQIEDALDAMRMAEEFVEGMTLETFTGDIKTVFTVERCFTIIGEPLSRTRCRSLPCPAPPRALGSTYDPTIQSFSA